MVRTKRKAPTATLLICNKNECVDDKDPDALACIQCARLVHFRCTGLPAYAIQSIIKNKGTFHCLNCVDVPDDLLQMIPSRERISSIKTDNELIQLRKENKEFKAKEIEQTLIIDDLKKDLKELQRQLDSSPSPHTLEYVEDKFATKLEAFKNELLQSIKEETNTLKSEISEVRTYAGVAKAGSPEEHSSSNKSLVTLIKEARKEENQEEEDKKRRSCNLIIHGVKEDQDHDKWVQNLVNKLHVKVNIKRSIRLGNESMTGKERPVLVTLTNEDEKLKVLNSLSVLKDDGDYKKVSVTEDLTPNQRDDIKKLSDETRKRNQEEKGSNVVWRIRGSSKNGFYIKKFKITTNQ